MGERPRVCRNVATEQAGTALLAILTNCMRPLAASVTCYFEGRISEDGHAITGRWYGGAGSVTGLYFFDAGVKQINWIWINSGGAFGCGILYKKDGHPTKRAQ